MDRALSDATNPGLMGSGINGNEGLFHIPEISKIGASPSNCSMSYPGHSLGETFPSGEIQSVYSTV